MNIAEKSLQLKQDFDDAYEAGYNKGVKETLSTLWDGLQNGGRAANYYYAFAYNRFDDDNFNPQYNIISTDTTTGTQCIFYNNNMITNTKVEIVAARNAGNCFYGMSNCHTIFKFTVNKDTSFNNTFSGCTALINIEIGGTIGKDISFSPCGSLSDASVQSIIDHLGTVTSATITFHTDVVAKLTDEQSSTILNKGWNIG